MTVRTLTVDRFRCLEHIELTADPHINIICGDNGAGKTSVLEALFYLGRGRSFRAPGASALVRSGDADFTVFAEVEEATVLRRLAISAGRGKSRVQVDGASGGLADLASALPIQIIEPEIHELVQGAPDRRRQFLDWGVFHVKHDFLGYWRQYRRALRQRNAALRSGAAESAIRAWDTELLEAGLVIDRERRAHLEALSPRLGALSASMSGARAGARYRPGWAETFEGSLKQGLARDRALGATQAGPHRAELILEIDEVPARHRLSRGQQKMLGAAMVLAQSQEVAETTGRQAVLLVDEPAAELDESRLSGLLEALVGSGLQLFVTTLERAALPLDAEALVFHVEHGRLRPLV